MELLAPDTADLVSRIAFVLRSLSVRPGCIAFPQSHRAAQGLAGGTDLSSILGDRRVSDFCNFHTWHIRQYQLFADEFLTYRTDCLGHWRLGDQLLHVLACGHGDRGVE